MREILVLCPQERDRRAVRDAGLEDRYAVRFVGSDLDTLESFDPAAALREWESEPADAVVATKDQSALLASVLAERRGLPGPSPQAVLACQHKPTARAVQARVAPEATPRFALLDSRPPLPYPFFVKPVVGRLSQDAHRIEGQEDLLRLPESGHDADRYAEIAAVAGVEPPSVRGFIAEELLAGGEVTLEGYVHGGRVTVVGVTDSVKYPGTDSFERFEYPSALSAERLAELADVSARVLPALGFDGGFFNVEFFVPDEGSVRIVEVNARIASQFTPLVLRLHGRSTYDALFRLALGEDPEWEPGEPDGVAVSYALRAFEDAFVEAVPEPKDDLEVLVRPGLRLSEQGVNDARSYRLAIFTEFGETREEAVARSRDRARALSFRLAPPR
ncbi:MAG TPA: ATP-grasp domain-containing protein [Gaiellaceae bacterium]|nr:ATP-grasp domain-containing protein [Gaiellaceae bacterium]